MPQVGARGASPPVPCGPRGLAADSALALRCAAGACGGQGWAAPGRLLRRRPSLPAHEAGGRLCHPAEAGRPTRRGVGLRPRRALRARREQVPVGGPTWPPPTGLLRRPWPSGGPPGRGHSPRRPLRGGGRPGARPVRMTVTRRDGTVASSGWPVRPRTGGPASRPPRTPRCAGAVHTKRAPARDPRPTAAARCRWGGVPLRRIPPQAPSVWGAIRSAPAWRGRGRSRLAPAVNDDGCWRPFGRTIGVGKGARAVST